MCMLLKKQNSKSIFNNKIKNVIIELSTMPKGKEKLPGNESSTLFCDSGLHRETQREKN